MIKLDVSDFSNAMLRDCTHSDSIKRRRYGKSPFYDVPVEYESKERFFHFDHTPIDDAEVESGCYDIVIVEGWQPDQGLDHGTCVGNWSGEGELLAEISVEPPSPTQPSRSPSPLESEDCANLSWLLNFKLDEIIGSNCEDQSSTEKNACRDVVIAGRSEVAKEETVDSGQKKPPYTYTELIELALRERGELTVSGIYHWISDRFPFFKPQDDRWKNSVRHNLSINPHFRKGAKAARGAGHLWTIAAPSAALDRVLATAFSARRLQTTQTLEQEVAAAAASILQHHHTEFLNPVSVEQVAAECGLLDGDLSFNF